MSSTSARSDELLPAQGGAEGAELRVLALHLYLARKDRRARAGLFQEFHDLTDKGKFGLRELSRFC